MRPSNDFRSSTSTLSAAPSLSSSKSSLKNSQANLTNSKLSINNNSINGKNDGTSAPTNDEVIAELLDKAKFYTSLCLGEFETMVKIFSREISVNF